MPLEYAKTEKRQRLTMAYQLLSEGKNEEARKFFLPNEEEPVQKHTHDLIYFGGVPEYTLETLKFPIKTQVRDIKRGVYYKSFADASRAYHKSQSFAVKRPDLFETVKVNWIVKYRGIEGSIDDVAYKTGLTRYTIMRYANRGDIEIIRAEVEK